MTTKHYRNLNGLVSQSTATVREAYDRGYRQARKDFKITLTRFIPEPHEGGMQFRCFVCERLAIADYPYCPYCGRKVE